MSEQQTVFSPKQFLTKMVRAELDSVQQFLREDLQLKKDTWGLKEIEFSTGVKLSERIARLEQRERELMETEIWLAATDEQQ